MEEKQKLVLCDIDGTIANNAHRQNLLKEFKDWDKFFSFMKDDEPIHVIIEMVKKKVESNNHLIFLTGRPEKYRKMTENWLSKYFDNEYSLLMRKDGDRRNKIIVKEEIFNENFQKKQIKACFENDPELIELWQKLGLNVIDINRIII